MMGRDILLIVVFVACFFGPTEPLMAAAHLLPLNVRFPLRSFLNFSPCPTPRSGRYRRPPTLN